MMMSLLKVNWELFVPAPPGTSAVPFKIPKGPNGVVPFKEVS
jgi:hypothetical protein